MLTAYIGAPLNLIGGLQMDGKPDDFTDWFLSANLYDATGTNLISTLSVAWIDQTQGLLALQAASTSTWPACKARIDCKLVTPAGEVVLGPPTYLRIAQSPMV